jgi:hypothetical protein
MTEKGFPFSGDLHSMPARDNQSIAFFSDAVLYSGVQNKNAVDSNASLRRDGWQEASVLHVLVKKRKCVQLWRQNGRLATQRIGLVHYQSNAPGASRRR